MRSNMEGPFPREEFDGPFEWEGCGFGYKMCTCRGTATGREAQPMRAGRMDVSSVSMSPNQT